MESAGRHGADLGVQGAWSSWSGAAPFYKVLRRIPAGICQTSPVTTSDLQTPEALSPDSVPTAGSDRAPAQGTNVKKWSPQQKSSQLSTVFSADHMAPAAPASFSF